MRRVPLQTFATRPDQLGAREQLPAGSFEYRLIALRECPTAFAAIGDNPNAIAAYFKTHVERSVQFHPDQECIVVVLLDVRKRIKGHVFVGIGTLDTVFTHPREIFRPAIVGAAAAIVLVHNHPSGDPSPTEADIKTTRKLIHAASYIEIPLLDHIIIGKGNGAFKSLRALGFFYE